MLLVLMDCKIIFGMSYEIFLSYFMFIHFHIFTLRCDISIPYFFIYSTFLSSEYFELFQRIFSLIRIFFNQDILAKNSDFQKKFLVLELWFSLERNSIIEPEFFLFHSFFFLLFLWFRIRRNKRNEREKNLFLNHFNLPVLTWCNPSFLDPIYFFLFLYPFLLLHLWELFRLVGLLF